MMENNAILQSIDKTLKELSANKKEKSNFVEPPSFYGTASDDIMHFLMWYEHVALLNSWSDERKVLHLCESLKDDACKWYTAKLVSGANHSWEQWKEALQNSFQNQFFNETSYLQLSERVQIPQETVESFYYDVINLCGRVNPTMPQIEQIRWLFRGLLPEYFEKMSIFSPITTAKFLEKLQQISRAKLIYKSNVYIKSTTPTFLPPVPLRLSDYKTCVAAMSSTNPFVAKNHVMLQEETTQKSDDKQFLIESLKNICNQINPTMTSLFEQVLETVFSTDNTNEPKSQPGHFQENKISTSVFKCHKCREKGHFRHNCPLRSKRRN